MYENVCILVVEFVFFFFQAEDGIRDLVRSRGLGDVYKRQLLCFAASNKSQADLETWLEPVYNHYIAKTGIMDAAYDVNVFFVPVFKGANAAMKSTLKQKFRENAQQDLWPHILFCENDLSAVQSALNMTKDNVPYFFLLDKSGQIVYRTSGAYTEEKFDAMDDKVE